MKFKVQVKVNFTVVERCHCHHATRAYKQQSRPHVSLQHGRMEAVHKQAPKRESVVMKDEIIVQRMTSKVTGKQQKYIKIGPREFVPFEFDEITYKRYHDEGQEQSAKTLNIILKAAMKGYVCMQIQ